MDVSSKASTAVEQVMNREQGFNAAELKILSTLSGPDRARMEAQLTLQKQQELVSFLTKALKNDTAMAVINALK